MNLKVKVNDIEIKVLEGPYIVNGKVSAQAKDFATTLIADLEHYKFKASSELLDLYNETWLDEDLGKLSQTQFIQLLTNPRIVLYDEIGAACIYFDDSNMFAGHFIEIHIDNFKSNNISIVA